ncbi:MAG: GNAT family N-acetyltransferase [Planctomycetota bacterium]
MIETPWIAPERHAGRGFLLRRYSPGDGSILREATTSSYEHLRVFMPWATPRQSRDEAEALVHRFCAHYLLGKDFILGIFSRDEKTLLGGCGYHLREGALESESAEIGMWIRASEAGHGLGTRVLVTLLGWGFSEWPWKRLSWRCDTRNAASVRIAEKAGMTREGVLRSHMLSPTGERRDTACFAALRGEWGAPGA